jgi:hypothetical protein
VHRVDLTRRGPTSQAKRAEATNAEATKVQATKVQVTKAHVKKEFWMKYMLLIYSNPRAWQEMSQDLGQVMTEVEAIIKETRESGEWVGGQALADPVQTRTVRVRDGVPVVTDGPYLESKEHLAGYCVFECESLERAEELAARWPDARYNAVELRPVMWEGGEEM